MYADTKHRRTGVRLGMLSITTALVLAAPAAAAAPGVATGGVANVSPQSATLKATVNPKRQATLYAFQYGTSKAYGTATPDVSAGAGATGVAVAANVVGLTPNTTYHYRVVAHSAGATTVGADKTFTTAKQPLGFTLAASPNPVPFLGAVTLQGVLSGTGSSGRQVALQQNVFPYTAGFATVGNPQVTGSTGAFAFPLLHVSTNTQYRVVTTAGTRVISSVVTLGVAVDVSTTVGTTRVRRGARTRFSGKIHPAKRGAIYAIQRQTAKGTWLTLATGTSTGGGSTFSRFDQKVRIRYSGAYRVFVGVADGYQVSNVGRSVKITARR